MNSIQTQASKIDRQIAMYMAMLEQHEAETEHAIETACCIEDLIAAPTWDTFVRFTRQVVADFFQNLPCDVEINTYVQPTQYGSPGDIDLTFTLSGGRTSHINITLLPPINAANMLVYLGSCTVDDDEPSYAHVLHEREDTVQMSVLLDPVQYADQLRMMLPNDYWTPGLVSRAAGFQEVTGVELEL